MQTAPLRSGGRCSSTSTVRTRRPAPHSSLPVTFEPRDPFALSVVSVLDPAVVVPKDSELMLRGEDLTATCNALSSLKTSTVWYKVHTRYPGAQSESRRLASGRGSAELRLWPQRGQTSVCDINGVCLGDDACIFVCRTDSRLVMETCCS